MMAVRAFLFNVWMWLCVGIIGGSLAILSLVLPRRLLMVATRVWAFTVLVGLWAICGIRYQVRGKQFVPTGAAIVAAKHQSFIETVTPFLLVPDPCFVMKQELFRLPVFGFVAMRLGMIPLDREGTPAAVKALMDAARKAAADGRQIIIFPEGTRSDPGKSAGYKPGVAGIYRDLGIPCVPLAHDTGRCWTTRSAMRASGTVTFEFLAPLPAGLNRAAFLRTLEDVVESASNALIADLRDVQPPAEPAEKQPQ